MSIKQNVLSSSVFSSFSSPAARTLASAGLIALLSACGSGTSSTSANSNSPVAQISTGTMTLDLPVTGSAASAPDQTATPTFHIAPVLLMSLQTLMHLMLTALLKWQQISNLFPLNSRVCRPGA